MRIDGRKLDELRPISFALDYIMYPEGSVLISMGNTKVMCNVTVEEGVPHWIIEQGLTSGWVTAEYAMLPRSTHTRTSRELSRPRARSQEIGRLIGRSLRAAVNLEELGEVTCIVDCDVIQADGGTRTAAITGGYVALEIALRKLIRQERVSPKVYRSRIAAVSVGVVNGALMLDLCYEEDAVADIDLNVVMNEDHEFVEIQGTSEGVSFTQAVLNEMLDLAKTGIDRIFNHHSEVLPKQ